MKNSFIILALLCAFQLYGQSEQTEFLEAKRLFNLGQYSSAKAAFGALTDSKSFSKYASFYYALSSYKQGNTKGASDMWKQMLLKYPNWDQKSELYYWLAMSGYNQKDYNEGLKYGSLLTNETGAEILEKNLIRSNLQSLDASELMYINETSAFSNKTVASILVEKLLAQSYEERDVAYINQLIVKWELEGTELSRLPKVKKDKYNVAVMLPFMFDSLGAPGTVLNNSLVTDLYQGILCGTEVLSSKSINLNVLPFDTKRDAKRTAAFLNENDPSVFDLIVGPLYPSPNEVVSSYSEDNQVNKINPISGNTKIMGENIYSFLFMPSYETMARALARDVKRTVTNKTGMIFFEQNERDSLFASVFREELEKDTTFQIVLHEGLNKDNAKAWLDTLIAQYDVFWTQSEADSLKDTGHLLRDRRLSEDELQIFYALKERRSLPDNQEMTIDEIKSFLNLVSYDEDGKPIYYYDKSFYMEKDSIGFVLGSTRKNFLANNLISVMETRGDSSQLYGLGEWIDFTMISYEQLERIGVRLAHTQYFDRDAKKTKVVNELILGKYGTMPSVFHFIGYELIMQLGNQMNENGKYFQLGLREGKYVEGVVLQGLKYGAANDNQVVPIVKFNEARLEIVNKEEYDN